MPFLDSLDIANRALQHLGAEQIATVDEDSKNNKECSFAYDKVRRAELRRNVWRFSIRKTVLRALATTTMLIVPPTWSSTATYLVGSIVLDSNGLAWFSTEPDNLNNQPGQSSSWDRYFGPLTASLYDSTASYYAGELVYKAGDDAGSYQVYLSLVGSNSDTPDTADAWDSTVTYGVNDVVSYGGSNWRGLIPFNLNTTPADGPLDWASTTTYSAAQTVTGSDNFIYSSVGGSNTGHDPITDDGTYWTNTHVANAWSRTPTLTTAATKWRAIDATIKNINMIYPIGSGPSTDTITKNVFRLPAGFLKLAPQDPKAGAISYIGAPSGRMYDDWNLEGDYLVSSDAGPIILRFVADITLVSAMDDMFCEGLACRVAIAVCEPITQSLSRLQTIASAYNQFMGEARIVNAIEIGVEEPPEDDFIACRA